MEDLKDAYQIPKEAEPYKEEYSFCSLALLVSKVIDYVRKKSQSFIQMVNAYKKLVHFEQEIMLCYSQKLRTFHKTLPLLSMICAALVQYSKEFLGAAKTKYRAIHLKTLGLNIEIENPYDNGSNQASADRPGKCSMAWWHAIRN